MVQDLTGAAPHPTPALPGGGTRWRPVLPLLVGAAATLLAIAWAGLGDVARAFAAAGWSLVPLAVAHVASLWLDAAAWWSLAPPPRPRLRVFLLARWVREAVNALLPAAQIGGEAAAVHLLAGTGAGAAWHGAVVALDLAAEFAAMVAFGAAASAVLWGLVGPEHRGEAAAVASAMLPPAALAIALLAGSRLGLLERLGRIARLLPRDAAPSPRRTEQVLADLPPKPCSARRLGTRWQALAGGLRDAEAAARAVWARPSGLMACLGLHGLGWVYGAVETWLALAALGHAASPERAFALEGTTEVLRAFGFAVPGLLGIQEGSLVLVGGMLGIGPAEAVALSLFRRARDVALGVPALGLWWLRGRLRTGRASRAAADADGRR